MDEKYSGSGIVDAAKISNIHPGEKKTDATRTVGQN
jgi:hypothetical protein